MKQFRGAFLATALAAATLTSATFTAAPAYADSAADISASSDAALQQLYATNPFAADLAKHAKAILIFPKIVKGGFIIAGAVGDGELKQDGKVAGYYNSAAGSWGLQAGAQSFSYVMFLMSDNAVSYLHNSDGWKIGAGPTVVVVDKGAEADMTTSNLKDDAYAFVFGQAGLMAGISLEGSKITQIHPD
ncbi:MAG TPA: YSC84-related protein [Caulobacteraceae bacterium]|jgi:lipid-binding SYLF domain-containing protein